jgi:large subunit ribosomal protein L3
MSTGLVGKKLGMVRVYDEAGVAHAVTVIHVGENVVTQVRTPGKDGYEALQLGYGAQKEQRLSKSVQGHLKKAGSAPRAVLREIRCEAGELKAGDILKASNFEAGQYVDVIGVSKGKGFAGVVKKHNMSGQNQTHGSMMHRRPGAIGMRSTPGRIWKNQGMPGHLGHEKKTVQNLRVFQVRDEDGALLVTGAVPGAPGSLVIVRKAIKKKAVKK